jgi:hypothetical protein
MSELKEHSIIGHIGVTPDGSVEVRTDSYVLRGDDEIVAGPAYTRAVYRPGDELPKDIAPRVKAVAKAVWTPEVIAAYEEVRAMVKKQIEADMDAARAAAEKAEDY